MVVWWWCAASGWPCVLLQCGVDNSLQVPPSCTKVSLKNNNHNHKKKEKKMEKVEEEEEEEEAEGNTDLRTLATWWRCGGGEVQQRAVREGMPTHRNNRSGRFGRDPILGRHLSPCERRARCAEHIVIASSDRESSPKCFTNRGFTIA
ncbi:hypothetical protein ISCGN_007895 [Ixodes scapularis]